MNVPDFSETATALAFSGEAVTRADFAAPGVDKIHSSADVGQIVLALRAAFVAGWNERAAATSNDPPVTTHA